MISNEKILELETRRQIYNTILKNPGLHLREISRRMNLSLSVLRYHINFLEKQDFIEKRSEGRYSRYYITEKIGKNDKNLLGVLRQDMPRKIVLLLLTAGPAELYNDLPENEKWDPSKRTSTHSLQELVELTKYWAEPYNKQFFLNRKRTAMEFHLNKLIKADIVETIKEGRKIKYGIKDEFGVWLFLADYKESFSDDLVDIRLDWYTDFIERRINAVINTTWEIFPHPYHA